MSEANKRLVREITDVVWNSRGLDRIPEFYAPDFVADYRPYAPLREGHDGIRGMVERAWTAFPDYHEELHELVAQFLEIRNGKVHKQRGLVDNLSALRQLCVVRLPQS